MNKNYKFYNLLEAKKQFLEDLKQDAHFIEYKKNCGKMNDKNYGVAIAGNGYTIDQNITSEQLIADFVNRSYVQTYRNRKEGKLYTYYRKRDKISRYKN